MSPRRQRSRQRRVARILDGAMDLVAAEGFEALTVTGLAQRLDVAVGGLYRYYDSKESLIAALTGRALEQLAADLDAARDRWRRLLPDDPQLAALADLWAAADWYVGLPRARPTLFALVAQAVAPLQPILNDAQTAPVRAPMVALIAQLEGLFEAAARCGALDAGVGSEDDRDLRRAVAFWSALHGTLLVAKFARFWPQRATVFVEPTVARAVRTALLSGWGAASDSMAAVATWMAAQDGLAASLVGSGNGVSGERDRGSKEQKS